MDCWEGCCYWWVNDQVRGEGDCLRLLTCDPTNKPTTPVLRGTVTSTIMVRLKWFKVQNALPLHVESFPLLKVSQLDHYWGRYMAIVKTSHKRHIGQERVKWETELKKKLQVELLRYHILVPLPHEWHAPSFFSNFPGRKNLLHLWLQYLMEKCANRKTKGQCIGALTTG